MKTAFLLLLLSFLLCTACSVSGGGDSGSGPRTIVFAAQAGDNYQIFTMREDGSGLRQLTHGDTYATNPAWSPNGTRIAFESGIKAPADTPNLYVMEVDGGNIHPLVTNPLTDGYPFPGRDPAWSPDGTKLVFDYCPNCEAGGRNYDIMVANLQAGTIDTLTHNLASDRYPTWSPDGQRIAFISNRDYLSGDNLEGDTDLYVINCSGDHLKRITTNGFVGLHSWRPVGKQIAFAANGLYLYSFDQDSVKDLNVSEARPIKWSKDGKQLLFAKINTYPKSDLFILNVGNGKTKAISFKSRQIAGVDWYSP